jgi:PadR family transcriptional regulator PadR
MKRVSPEALKGHLDALLLAVVASGPAHGYRIVEDLRLRSGGAFDLPEGTVYPALHRLERGGLLASRWTLSSGRRRRVYHITRRGRSALARQRADWERFAGAVEAVLA